MTWLHWPSQPLATATMADNSDLRNSPLTCQWNLRSHHPGLPWPGCTDPVTLTSAQLSDLSTWLHWLSQSLATPTNAGSLCAQTQLPDLSIKPVCPPPKATMTWLHWPSQSNNARSFWPHTQLSDLPIKPVCPPTKATMTWLHWPHQSLATPTMLGHSDLTHNSLTCQSNPSVQHPRLPWPGYTDSASSWPLPQCLVTPTSDNSPTCQSSLHQKVTMTWLHWPKQAWTVIWSSTYDIEMAGCYM